jgi:hypothetical protein
LSKILQTKDIESPPLPGEHRRLVQRIAESSHFRKSPRLREFLFFIVERYMEGRAHELTEQDIGCRVFERPLGYKPSEDNIVRVSVRQLRSKLKDYFDAEGLEEEFTLEVPRGGYVPVFKPVEHVGTERGRTWPIRVAAAASVFALVALAVALWFWRENRTLKAAGAAPSVPTLVSELLLKSNQPVTIVLSDFALVLMQNLSGGRDVPLEDYAKRSYLAEPSDLKEQPILSLWRTLATRQITSVDNVTLVSRLLKAHPDHRDQVSIRHARSMDIRDFKTGSFIIQGGSISTPWAALFERQLNFRTEKSKSGLVMRNVRPQPGEPAQYGPAVSGANGKTSYARLDFVPNLSGTGKILLVAGFDMAASEAAAEFVLSPASVSLVQHALAQSDLSKIGHFELVLETSALDGTGNGARIVAFRR